MSDHYYIVAHRGDFNIENTLHAFERAWKNNIQIVECDIRLSKHGVIIVSHDNCLKRTTKKDIKINKTSWANLKDIVLKNGYNIPELLDILKLAKRIEKNKVIENPKIIIEMKTNKREIGIHLAKFLNKHKQFIKYIEIVMSFSMGPICAFSQNYNKKPIPLYLLTNNLRHASSSCIKGYYIKFDPLFLEDDKILKNMIKSYPIGIWGLEDYDNKETINKLFEIGIKYVNTNRIENSV